MLHPCVGGFELMAVLENLARRLVEEPHAFIGQRGDRKRTGQQGGEDVLCHDAKVVKDREGWLGEVAAAPEARQKVASGVSPGLKVLG